jgi:hypothetical protein
MLMADISSVPVATAPAPWTVDARGYLLTPSGAKAARIEAGRILLWDKWQCIEVPFTLADWLACQTQMQRGET